MVNIVEVFTDRVSGKIPIGLKRAKEWGKVRKQYLKAHPLCECCGGNTKLRVHHRMPFHLYPELELQDANLITLCEGGKHVNCHLVIGHLFFWKAYNPRVEKDCLLWNNKIATRPTERITL